MGIKSLNLKKFVYKKFFVNTVDKISFLNFQRNYDFLFNFKRDFYILNMLSTKPKPLLRI